MEKEINEAMNKVALRYGGIYLDVDKHNQDVRLYKPFVSLVFMMKNLAECGYTLSEELLHALALQPDSVLKSITETVLNTMGEHRNWTPLVKGWNVPTNETLLDRAVAYFFTMFNQTEGGTTLPCGHIIPDGTFHIERYNGCPLCGTPFVYSKLIYKGHGSKLKELDLFTRKDMEDVFRKLLESPVPLDATELDSLKLLIGCMEIPEGVDIKVKESCMVVVSALLGQGREDEASAFLKTPRDILRFLWYQHTGKTIIIRPKTLVSVYGKWNNNILDRHADAKDQLSRKSLRLKYHRNECRRIAGWLNALPMDPVQMAENMHPHRGMWVRFIRALRLAEYAKKPGYEKLSRLMDVFYNERYITWEARLNDAIDLMDQDTAFAVLSERPGQFARYLFSTMLRFGYEPTLEAFRQVAGAIPLRLILSLVKVAESYFDVDVARYASPVTGGKVLIQPNNMLRFYSKEECTEMVVAVNKLLEDVVFEFFTKKKTDHHKMFIDPGLFDIPVAVGDRSTVIQDASCALQGMRFHVEGDKVRVFMQWGVGLPAQHLDMDLSCSILYDDKRDECAYYALSTVGACHSGDIQYIPDQIGTAEYIELDIPELYNAGAKYVVLMCNAYSNVKLVPNLLVGWMSSEYRMEISEESGVAYDPSCVQHMVRISQNNLSRGLTFGILEVATREITWLEVSNQNQVGCLCSVSAIIDYLKQLRQKYTVGQLLESKARAQGYELVDSPDKADESYTSRWAMNPSNVTALLD